MGTRIYRKLAKPVVHGGAVTLPPGRDETMLFMQHVTLARRLDLEAGVELAHGHHAAAERLAWRAAELRGAGA